MSTAPERPPANPPARFSIAILLTLVAVLALFLGAMKNGSGLAMKLTWTATALALFLGLLGALVRREGAWVGFALFGWGYALHSLGRVIDPNLYQKLVFYDVLDAVVTQLQPMPGPRPTAPAINPQFLTQFANDVYLARADHPGQLAILDERELDILRDFQSRFLAAQHLENEVRLRRIRAMNIGHAIIALALGLLGSAAGRWLSPRPEPRVPIDAGPADHRRN